MSDQSGYAERQSEWVKNAGIEIGDSVLITTRIDNWGVTTDWDDIMDGTVGLVGRVARIQHNVGIQVACPAYPRRNEGQHGWWHPFFVLVKVEE